VNQHPRPLQDTLAVRTYLHVPIWLLALVTFSGTLAMHIFVPALPIAALNLGASTSEMQMTVSLYIFGLAVGQLIYGPLSDRFGRRPALMGGLVLYTLAGLAALFAPNAHALIAARLFQALGGCAGLVIGRAIVRDTSDPNDTAKRLAVMNLMVTVGPGAAPIIGGLLATSFGWRSIFIVLCGLGIANFLLTWRLIPETGKPGSDTSVATLGRNYIELLRSKAFLGFAIGGGCATTSMYAFIASAPFIFGRDLGRPAQETGIYLALLIGGVWLGSMMASRMIGKVPMAKLLILSNLASIAAALVFLAAVLSGHLSVWLTVSSMVVLTMGVGIASPTALTRAVSINPAVVGSASGLYGFTQMAVGAICTALAGFGRDPALSAAIVLVGAGVLAQCCFWMALRQPRSV
jgi:DHA1 family bicyclomycin/chloramphenicol resistance-like MFS transporter